MAYRQYDQRINEILDVAENLFTTKGFANSTVNDILDGVGIGKGTFYHYFKSKEEVMEAVISRMADFVRTGSQQIADIPNMTATEKIHLVFSTLPVQSEELLNELHRFDNSAMHMKGLVETTLAITPAMTQILQQGIDEGVFHTPYPQETFEFLFTATQFFLDTGLFHWTEEEFLRKLHAFIYLIELSLGADKGSFDFLNDVYGEQTRRLAAQALSTATAPADPTTTAHTTSISPAAPTDPVVSPTSSHITQAKEPK